MFVVACTRWAAEAIDVLGALAVGPRAGSVLTGKLIERKCLSISLSMSHQSSLAQILASSGLHRYPTTSKLMNWTWAVTIRLCGGRSLHAT